VIDKTKGIASTVTLDYNSALHTFGEQFMRDMHSILISKFVAHSKQSIHTPVSSFKLDLSHEYAIFSDMLAMFLVDKNIEMHSECIDSRQFFVDMIRKHYHANTRKYRITCTPVPFVFRITIDKV
jgi:hypothetical protein